MNDYVVVFRDHSGHWRAVAMRPTWELAEVAFSAMVITLRATDYYDDCPPHVAKIVQAGVDYATAAPLMGPIKQGTVSA